MALLAVIVFTVRRGNGVCRIVGFQVLRLPDNAGIMFNFQFVKPFERVGGRVLQVVDEAEYRRTCAVALLDASAAVAIGGDLFPRCDSGESGAATSDPLPVTPPSMTRSL